LECDGAALSIVFTDDKEICKLNSDFRGKPKPTDVLSFPQEQSRSRRRKSEILGDVVISVQTARRQAREYATTLRDELLRLIIHGVLHLVGYEHESVSKAERLKMERLEARLLELLSA
jgi:probable rRNA maturation factor